MAHISCHRDHFLLFPSTKIELLQLLKALLVASKVKTCNSNMFGSASQNQFSSLKAILDEATIPSF
ncbi:hypothetical protein MTR_2g102233 [Medicago truncatula]|uniref:Uncharacterized protein n=1 Tax=Medicago truncatula TaxID=3880 RepID=A0A072VN47_MEDTR|nr:hypothetical protein MTR_2g102233 [Medicago truncatula]